MQTRDTAPAKEGNIVIITHTAHVQEFSPRLVSVCHHDAGTRDAGGGLQGTKQSHSSLASPLYEHYQLWPLYRGRAMPGIFSSFPHSSPVLVSLHAGQCGAAVCMQSHECEWQYY